MCQGNLDSCNVRCSTAGATLVIDPGYDHVIHLAVSSVMCTSKARSAYPKHLFFRFGLFKFVYYHSHILQYTFQYIFLCLFLSVYSLENFPILQSGHGCKRGREVLHLAAGRWKITSNYIRLHQITVCRREKDDERLRSSDPNTYQRNQWIGSFHWLGRNMEKPLVVGWIRPCHNHPHTP